MTASTRRSFLAGSISALALSLLPMPALALTDAQAKSLVDGLVGRINTVIASGKSESAMIRDFEAIFRQYADMSYVAAYALGNDGRRASTDQRRAFSAAFSGYIARKYGKRFREFIGGRIEVGSVRQTRNYHEVKTTAFLRGQSPFEVAFHVSDRTGKPLFFNMFIEGINMLLTERTEVGAMLDRRRGDLNALIADLKTAG